MTAFLMVLGTFVVAFVVIRLLEPDGYFWPRRRRRW